MTQVADKALIDALTLAINSEKEMKIFYETAASKTKSEIGKKVFLQLVDFEQGHCDALTNMLENFKNGVDISYEGKKFENDGLKAPFEKLTEIEAYDDIKALETAVESEQKAWQAYQDLGYNAAVPQVAEVFYQLAEEEKMHKQILESQLASLKEKGGWSLED